MILTKNSFNKFFIRKHPMEQEVFVHNGETWYGGQGVVVALDKWRRIDGGVDDMVCIRFGHGEVWFAQDDERIEVIPNQKYAWE